MRLTTPFTTLCLAGMLACHACQSSRADSMVVVKQTGEITVFGEQVPDFDALRIRLLDSLSNMNALPEDIGIQFVGEIGMGLRQETETIAAEALAAARLARSAPVIEVVSFRKSQGSDCDQPDTLRTDCAIIDLQYPDVAKGEKALQEGVRQWARSCLATIVSQGYDPASQTTDLDRAASEFFSALAEHEGSVQGGLAEASASTEVMLNNGKYLTLAINGYSFQGGAHGNHSHAMGTFDVQTGGMLTWDDLVTDKDALLQLAEGKVRQIKAEVFAEGFDFNENFPFVLASSYGLMQEGIVLYYVPYEIMPYAYGSTEVLLTFEELGELSRIRF